MAADADEGMVLISSSCDDALVESSLQACNERGGRMLRSVCSNFKQTSCPFREEAVS
jgi:hypothetical protein